MIKLSRCHFADYAGIELPGQLAGVQGQPLGGPGSATAGDLSDNLLYEDIPFSISKLKQLELLNLKNNQLTGPIPSTLTQIPNLKTLDLARNQLIGEIPRLIYWNEVLQYLDECKCNPVRYFAIISTQRSGSGWFETLLNSHINISSNGEIFSVKVRRSNISTIVETLDKIYNLDWLTSASKNECTAAVGLKWMLNQKLKDVQDFLRVPQRDLKSQQVKIHKGSLSQHVENWDDIQRALYGTPYESFLHSDYNISEEMNVSLRGVVIETIGTSHANNNLFKQNETICVDGIDNLRKKHKEIHASEIVRGLRYKPNTKPLVHLCNLR
ncbi:hypothetical protein TEA_016132 [Camellia sinensis var. sinensis]|uniref:Uncharacterized protein n=1 Tax=Camellia sinensis var. sinensis TaxID=542762 RepID=A0A4S4D1Y1_CAMSN|nr:hypothetical protein TEA_016132 [Camellia sinensis var. sinensis]